MRWRLLRLDLGLVGGLGGGGRRERDLVGLGMDELGDLGRAYAALKRVIALDAVVALAVVVRDASLLVAGQDVLTADNVGLKLSLLQNRVFVTATAASADPLIRRQQLAIAESLLREVQLMPFTWCDPVDANVETATSTAGCATLAEGIGPESGETRYGATYFDNVNDYAGFTMSGIRDLSNTAVAGLNGYSASIAVAAAALDSISAGSGDALQAGAVERVEHAHQRRATLDVCQFLGRRCTHLQHEVRTQRAGRIGDLGAGRLVGRIGGAGRQAGTALDTDHMALRLQLLGRLRRHRHAGLAGGRLTGYPHQHVRSSSSIGGEHTQVSRGHTPGY